MYTCAQANLLHMCCSYVLQFANRPRNYTVLLSAQYVNFGLQTCDPAFRQAFACTGSCNARLFLLSADWLNPGLYNACNVALCPTGTHECLMHSSGRMLPEAVN